MDIAQLKFRADTTEIDKAGDALDDLNKSANRAQKSLAGVNSTLDAASSVGGPIGDIAERFTSMKQRADEAVTSVRGLVSTVGSVGSAAVGATAAFVGLVGAAGIFAAIRFQSTLDEITKLAEQFGYSAGQADVLNSKLEGRGGLAAFEKDIERVVRVLGKADEESSAAYEALETLGINAKTASDPMQVLQELTEKYGDKVKQGNVSLDEQAALQRALGTSWKETIFRQKEAADAMDMYNSFAEKGLGLSQGGVAATADYNDSLDGLGYVLKIVGSELVSIVLPAFSGLINALVDSYKNGGLVKVAFEGIKVATNLAMVPLRALFNIFIQIDAAIQSVGKGLGAFFAAIATRSLDPFDELKKDIESIWKTANTRTVGVWGSEGTANTSVKTTTSTGPITPGKPKRTGAKPKESIFADGDPVQNMLRKKFDEYNARNQAALDKQDEDEARRLEDLRKKYTEMLDPLNKYTVMLSEIRLLRQAGLIDAETQGDMELEVETQRQNALDKTKEKLTEISEVGKLVFQNVSKAFSDMVMQGKVNFKDMASTFIKSLLDMYIQAQIMIPLFTMLKSLTGWGWLSIPVVASANGNVFGPSGLLKSAKGNVFDGPTLHGYSGGIGMLGEAGPEAIMPLRRGPDGKLGVAASGMGDGGGVVQQISITVQVQGGKNAQETGQIVSTELLKVVRGQVKQELAMERRQAAYGY